MTHRGVGPSVAQFRYAIPSGVKKSEEGAGSGLGALRVSRAAARQVPATPTPVSPRSVCRSTVPSILPPTPPVHPARALALTAAIRLAIDREICDAKERNSAFPDARA